MSKLATIGYEGASVDDFIATLKAAGVELLLDIRACAVSRRKGFSKNALSAAITDAGIEYVHLVSLGDPKEGREAARAGHYEKFRKIFSKHLATKDAKLGLQVLKNYTDEFVVCLMCYERNPEGCHRSLVASALTDGENLKIQHLGVKEGIAKNGRGKGSTRKSLSTGQGAAASR